MKVVAMSDLHGYLPKADGIPECDVICICGDIVPLEYQDNMTSSVAWFCLEFIPWTDKLNCKKVVFIAGNHDFFLYNLAYTTEGMAKPKDVLKKLLPGNNYGKHKVIYLQDSSVEIEGKLFYGTPWVGGLPGWAFNGVEEELDEIWGKIPYNLDVLLTHQPSNFNNEGRVLQYAPYPNFGSDILARKLNDKHVRYTFCGHVHSGDHKEYEYKPDCEVVNVSVKDENYMPKYITFKIYEI